MRRPFVLVLAAIFPQAVTPAPVPKPPVGPTGVLVLDDCDETYKGKDVYEDNLTFITPAGKLGFRTSGLNNCQSIGSSHMVAADPARRCVWAVELVAKRVRRFDLTGRDTLSIEGVHGSALAVDPATGNVWVLASEQGLGSGRVEVYDGTGRQLATHAVSGWDIAYDRKAKAFWVAERNLTKIAAGTGEVLFTAPISTFSASSVDADPRTGEVWVAVREHKQVAKSEDRLLKFGADGKELVSVPRGDGIPFRVSVDPRSGEVWVATLRKSVDRFSGAGQLLASHPTEALAVQADPAGNGVWVVTPTDTRRLTVKGEVSVATPHAAKTGMAWIASVE